MNQPQNQKLSWRLCEISGATGLSLPFLRKEQYAGNLKTRKIGGAVIVLDADLKRYLTGEDSEYTNAQNQDQSLTAAV